MTSFRAVLLALCAGLVLAVPAHAQDTTIDLSAAAGRALTVAAEKPAVVAQRRVLLPTTHVTIAGASATVDHGGALTLRSAGRSVRLTALQVTVGRRSRLSARVAGARRTVATIVAPAARRAVDAAGTYITEAPLVLTSAFARRLGVAPGRLGTIDLEAAAGPASGGAGDIPGAPSAPTVTGPPTPGGAASASRPAGATAITGGTVRWSPRASWLSYLASSGEAGSVSAGAPATYDAGALTYTLPITGGWFDGRGAVIDTAGASAFRWAGHSLDLAFADWTFDLASSTPKAVATVQRASGAPKASLGRRRPVGLVKLNGVAPTVSGSTVTWADVPMRLAAEGVPLYRAYLYDSDQGRLTISATLG